MNYVTKSIKILLYAHARTIADDKKSRRTSLQVLLPKLPSTDSLSGNSPGPASPGDYKL